MFLSSLTWGEYGSSAGWSTLERAQARRIKVDADMNHAECNMGEESRKENNISSRSINKSDKALELFKASADKQYFLGVLEKINAKGIFPLYHTVSATYRRRCIGPVGASSGDASLNSVERNTGTSFWSCLPVGVHPSGGHIPADRIERKVNQVENMLEMCIILIDAAALSKERRREGISETVNGEEDSGVINEADCALGDLDAKLHSLIDEIQKHELTNLNNKDGNAINIRERLVSVLTRLEGELKQDSELATTKEQEKEKEKEEGAPYSAKNNKKKNRIKLHNRRLLAFRNIVSSWVSEYDDLTAKISARSAPVQNNRERSQIRKTPPTLRIVEFCAGSGFVILPLAALYPDFEFVLVDRKGPSLLIGKQRIRDANLKNVTIIQGNIEDFNSEFDVGVSLHACGSATDTTIEKCIKQRASLLCCSCCIGKITSTRSRFLSSSMAAAADEVDFKHTVRAADFGHQDIELYSDIDIMRRICKSYIELDRQMHLSENGYNSRLVVMTPKSCSPKNDMIIGWPVPEIGDGLGLRFRGGEGEGRGKKDSDLSGNEARDNRGFTEIIDSHFQLLTEASNDSLRSYLFSDATNK